MQYTVDEALRETLRRSDVLKKRRRRMQTGALSAGVVVLLGAVLTVGAGLTAGQASVIGRSAYGAFLLPSEAGGYILAGVAAFVVGVLVTLLCIRFRGEGDGAGKRAGKTAVPPGEGPRQQNTVRTEKENQEDKTNTEGEMR